MDVIFPIILITTIISLLEFPKLLSRRLIKEIFLFSALIIVSVIIGILKGFQIKVLNPADWIEFVFRPMTKIIVRLLNN
jgi:hypothetical protein